MPYKIPAIILWFLLACSCKETQKSTSTDTETENRETYFSVSQFLDDQWANRSGLPYTLQRIATINGQSDTAYVLLDSVLWKNIRAPFDDADIGTAAFLDKYKFEFFEDETTEQNNYIYQAKDQDLLMQKMVIGADMFTDMVRSVYIETNDSRKGYTRTQKLSYFPDQTIQIQEFEKSSATPEKDLIIIYKYKY